MVEIETMDSGGKVRVAVVFGFREAISRQNYDIEQKLTIALNRASLTPASIRSVEYPESNTVLGIIEINRRSILANRVDDMRNYFLTLGGYNAMYITTDDPEEQPDIKRHMARLGKM